MHATLGAAAATLLVVGGILAGPSLIECSRDADGFGSCLREKVAESGLIAPETESVTKPEIVSDISSEPPLPTDWMEVNANEYEPPIGPTVDLDGSSAELAVAPMAPGGPLPIEVALAPAAELSAVSLAPVSDIASVSLGGPQLSLAAETATFSASDEPAQVALVGPEGQIGATSPVLVAPVDAAAVLAEPRGLSVEAVIPEPIEQLATTTVLGQTPPDYPMVELSAEPAPTVIEFDPQYPNVLVLPPPAEGDDSSFRSLQLN